MDVTQAVIDKALCAEATVKFFNCLDNRNYRDLAVLMAQDGKWERLGEVLTGPEQVLAALEKRSPTWFTRHFVHNIDVVLTDPDHAEVWYLMIIYLRDAADPNTPADVTPPIARTLVGTDTMARTAAGWKFTEKKTGPAYS